MPSTVDNSAKRTNGHIGYSGRLRADATIAYRHSWSISLLAIGPFDGVVFFLRCSKVNLPSLLGESVRIEVRMDQAVYEVEALGRRVDNPMPSLTRAFLKQHELAYQSLMDAEVTFDASDVSMAPGSVVLAIIGGKVGIVRVSADGRAAVERQRSWPAQEVEPIGRVIEVRWRP